MPLLHDGCLKLPVGCASFGSAGVAARVGCPAVLLVLASEFGRQIVKHAAGANHHDSLIQVGIPTTSALRLQDELKLGREVVGHGTRRAVELFRKVLILDIVCKKFLDGLAIKIGVITAVISLTNSMRLGGLDNAGWAVVGEEYLALLDDFVVGRG